MGDSSICLDTAKATPGAGAANVVEFFFPKKQQRVIKWDPFWRDQMMQGYGDFEGFEKINMHCFFGW